MAWFTNARRTPGPAAWGRKTKSQNKNRTPLRRRWRRNQDSGGACSWVSMYRKEKPRRDRRRGFLQMWLRPTAARRLLRAQPPLVTTTHWTTSFHEDHPARRLATRSAACRLAHVTPRWHD